MESLERPKTSEDLLKIKKQSPTIDQKNPTIDQETISTEELDNIMNIQAEKIILVGDLNSKHSSWNKGKENYNGTILRNYVDKKQIQIIAPNDHTRTA